MEDMLQYNIDSINHHHLLLTYQTNQFLCAFSRR